MATNQRKLGQISSKFIKGSKRLIRRHHCEEQNHTNLKFNDILLLKSK